MRDDLDLVALRSHAVQVAYRMVGSRTDAEDLAQEAVLRVRSAADTTSIRSPEAFVTTVTTRLALDHLRSARVRRETYLGPWLPEPVGAEALPSPADAAELADSVSFAMLVVLETLNPVERAAFVLHDVFGHGYGELAEALDRSEVACRQLVSRARRRVTAARPRVAVDASVHRRVLESFLTAARSGDVEGLMAVLADDVVHLSDGGSERRAARHPICGRDRVARFVAKVLPKIVTPEASVVITQVNGEPGFVVRLGGDANLAGAIALDGRRVTALHWVLNPDKLRWIDAGC
jgi:RNA polymerase sigma-70 factor, ECF subfamily